jgi:hypothetical protein
VIEPPDINYPWLKAGPITIDTGEGQPHQSSSTLPVAPAGTRTTWMYLGELNRFLLLSVETPHLNGRGPKRTEPNDVRAHFRGQC